LRFDNIVLIEPQPSPEIITLGQRGLRINPALDTFAASAIVIAVKPQVAPQLSATLAPLIGRDTLVISIMAGRTLAFLEKALPAGTALVRAMPNMPAAIGRGITVAVPNARVSGAQRDLADKLLAAAGATEWIARASRPACRPTSRRGSRARRWRARASSCTARRSTRPRCARTSPRRAAPLRRRSTS
jgi:pyrroline-5-carboxylate reductase